MIVPIPEQPHVPAMVPDVVHDGGLGQPATAFAGLAQRMAAQIGDAILTPLVTIATLRGRAPVRIHRPLARTFPVHIHGLTWPAVLGGCLRHGDLGCEGDG